MDDASEDQLFRMLLIPRKVGNKNVFRSGIKCWESNNQWWNFMEKEKLFLKFLTTNLTQTSIIFLFIDGVTKWKFVSIYP